MNIHKLLATINYLIEKVNGVAFMKPDQMCINEHVKNDFDGYPVVSLESDLRPNPRFKRLS